jgi:transposase
VGLRPPKARTWRRRGRTPVVEVSGKGSGRVSIAGLVCTGQRSRLIYRTLIHRGRKGERRSFADTDYAALLDAARQQLGGPIVLVWDNLNTHISVAMRALIAARDWLHVIRLPPYAPDLNPTGALVSAARVLTAPASEKVKIVGSRPFYVRGCARLIRLKVSCAHRVGVPHLECVATTG